MNVPAPDFGNDGFLALRADSWEEAGETLAPSALGLTGSEAVAQEVKLDELVILRSTKATARSMRVTRMTFFAPPEDVKPRPTKRLTSKLSLDLHHLYDQSGPGPRK